MKLMTNLIFLFLSTVALNCNGNSNILDNNSSLEENNLEVLKALRLKTGSFNNGSRDLKSSVKISADFNQKFPGTDISCGYVLRYYFYTNIHLNSTEPALISMDGSTFIISNNAQNDNGDLVIYETKVAINLIKSMYYGNLEYKEFIKKYPTANIDI